MKRGVVTALVVYFASSRAYALDPPFGARGQVAFTDNLSTSVSFTWFQLGGSALSADVSPSLDWFVARNFAIGLEGGASYQLLRAPAANDIEDIHTWAGLRVAPNLPFNRWVSVWPRATIYFDWLQHKDEPFYPPPSVTTGPQLTIYVPLVFQVRGHFFIGFGPLFAHRWGYLVGASLPPSELNIASMNTMIGGYIGGDKPEHDDELPIHWRAFGEEHEVVLEMGGGFVWRGTTNNAFTHWSIGGSAAVGYFVLEHLSLNLGFDASYARDETVGVGATEVGSLSIAPGLGYDIPISSRFSFYPRAYLGFGAIAATGGTALRVYVSAYAPILFHAAPHFFIGFGPVIARDLADKLVSRPSDNDPGTLVGASLTLGGFL